MRQLIIFAYLFICAPSFSQQTVGIFLNDPDSFQGYTLFGNNETTYLIDNCGKVINTWVSAYRPGQSMYLLENGNLLRTAEIESDFDAPGGLGGRFELFNWEGELLWSYEYADTRWHAHHDIAPLPNGNFLALIWQIRSETEAKHAGRQYNGEVWSERIVEIEIQGTTQANIVWEWRLWDHLIQDQYPAKDNYGSVSEHPERVDINFIGEGQETAGNWIHLNAIDYHPELDQIVVSSRLFSEIWVIDHSTTTNQAASSAGGRSGHGGDLLYRFGNPQAYKRGAREDRKLFHQHDIKWISPGHPHQGKWMVFNNDAAQGRSSVEIWTPPLNESGRYIIEDKQPFGPLNFDWSYAEAGFYSQFMSSAQMLPNGNIFICEGMSGHLFEIRPDEKIVWDYINPVNSRGFPAAQGGTVRQNQVFRATRYAPDHPAFIGRTLQPGQPVEINPWDIDCTLHDFATANELMNRKPFGIEILGNPIADFLYLRIENSSKPV